MAKSAGNHIDFVGFCGKFPLIQFMGYIQTPKTMSFMCFYCWPDITFLPLLFRGFFGNAVPLLVFGWGWGGGGSKCNFVIRAKSYTFQCHQTWQAAKSTIHWPLAFTWENHLEIINGFT